MLNRRQIAADINQSKSFLPSFQSFEEESVVFTFPYQASGNHVTEPSTVGQVISERHWKSTFDFTEIVNKFGLKREIVCQIVRFISQFSLKLYIKL